MMNDHNSRWFARNQLKNLRIILVTIVISINEKDFSTAEQLLSAVGYIFNNKEVISELAKDLYISSWIFETMPRYCSIDYNYMTKYLRWIQIFVGVEGRGEMSKDQKNGSNFFTQILNTVMGAVSLRRIRNETFLFNFSMQISKEQLQHICGQIIDIFSNGVKNNYLCKNIAHFSKKSNFDMYFRFLCELAMLNCDKEFTDMAFALLDLLTHPTVSYTLPHCFRKYSVLFLQ